MQRTQRSPGHASLGAAQQHIAETALGWVHSLQASAHEQVGSSFCRHSLWLGAAVMPAQLLPALPMCVSPKAAHAHLCHALGGGEDAGHPYITELGQGNALGEEHILALQVTVPNLHTSPAWQLKALPPSSSLACTCPGAFGGCSQRCRDPEVAPTIGAGGMQIQAPGCAG